MFSSGHVGRLNVPQPTVGASPQAHEPSAVCRRCLHGILGAVACHTAPVTDLRASVSRKYRQQRDAGTSGTENRRAWEPRVLGGPQRGPAAGLQQGFRWGPPWSLAYRKASPLAASTSCFPGTSRVLGRAQAAEFLMLGNENKAGVGAGARPLPGVGR